MKTKKSYENHLLPGWATEVLGDDLYPLHTTPWLLPLPCQFLDAMGCLGLVKHPTDDCAYRCPLPSAWQ